MTRSAALTTLLQAETTLKRTTRGYSPRGVHWRSAMPAIWSVREWLGDTPDGRRLAHAHGTLKRTTRGYNPRGVYWRSAMAAIDSIEARLAVSPVPPLGPVVRGDKPILLQSPTHNTDGVMARTGSEYPAFDSGWRAGRAVLAVEPMRVTRQSSAMGADAFYATGVSGLRYWYGHIVKAPATGTRLALGDIISVIAAIPGADHVHLGIDARSVIGHDLRWGRDGDGPDYSWGADTIGVQLAKALGA